MTTDSITLGDDAAHCFLYHMAAVTSATAPDGTKLLNHLKCLVGYGTQ
jgi:hypothetical protein